MGSFAATSLVFKAWRIHGKLFVEKNPWISTNTMVFPQEPKSMVFTEYSMLFPQKHRNSFSTKASKVIVDNFIQKAWKKQGFFPCFFHKIVQYEIILKEAWIFSVLFPQNCSR